MKSTIKEWIEILEHRYKQHQSETLDHKDCKEIADIIKELQWQVEQSRDSIKFGKTLEECHNCKKIGCDDIIRYCEDCDNLYCEDCLEEFSDGTHTEDGFQDDDFAICKDCVTTIKQRDNFKE